MVLATLRCILATGFWNTPSEDEISAGVKDGDGEAEDEDIEEPAQLPVLLPVLDLLPQLSHINAITLGSGCHPFSVIAANCKLSYLFVCLFVCLFFCQSTFTLPSPQVSELVRTAAD